MEGRGFAEDPGVEGDPLSTPTHHLTVGVLEWRRRVSAEYRSAALTAQLLHRCIQLGIDDALLATAQRIVADELEPARISHDVAVALGGPDEPVPLDPGELQAPDRPEGPFADLVERAVQGFCLGETFAVPLFHAMRQGAEGPARAALDRILRDEAVHRQFGWDLLDALLEVDGDGVRAYVTRRLPGWLAGFERAYHPDHPGEDLGPAERAAGLIPLSAYRAAYVEAVETDIRPRLARRQITW